MIDGIQRLIAALLGVGSICGISYLLCRYVKHNIHILKLVALSVSFALIGYMIVSVPLFWLDSFSVIKTAVAEFALVAGAALTVFIIDRKSKVNVFEKIDRDVKKSLIPLGIAVLAFAMSFAHFGFFGMGQDQGVYQVKAINLMYGNTDRVYTFDEYDLLETEEEKAEYVGWIHGRLEGLYTTELRGISDNILPWLTGDPSEYEASDSIFHGIPTYPAILALWGTIFGLKNMVGVQTLVFILTAITIWYITENLKLKKAASILACSIFLFSPEVLWVAKSTLTEGPLALIISLFIMLLTAEEKEKRWNSAWMVVTFSVLHVTIYVMISMFLVLYYLLYLKTEQKQYLRAAVISCVGFILGYTFMVYVSPNYTLGNTGRICRGPITVNNVYYVLMGVAVIGIIVALILGGIHFGNKIGTIFDSKIFQWICRCFIISMLFFVIRRVVILYFQNNDLIGTVRIDSLYNMLWMTGLIAPTVAIIVLIIKPKVMMNSEEGLTILFLFFYSVMLFCSVFMEHVSYCYYYGRYLVPYIPVTCILSAMIWNQFSKEKMVIAILSGVVVCLPFDMTIIHQKDDTKVRYEILQKFAESINTPNSAVIFEYDRARIFLLPIKAISGADCYFLDYGNIDEQAELLSRQYDHVYCLTDSLDWNEIVSVKEPVWLDDNESYRMRLCPFPYEMKCEVARYSLYEYSVK